MNAGGDMSIIPISYNFKSNKIIIMKTYKSISLSIALLFITAVVSAQVKTETIKVSGNCGMCETKIEKAAKEAGATSAEWSSETKQIKVKYNSSTTNAAKIQQAIAKVGYDTQDFKATNESYDKLHGCCKYERTEASEKSCCGKCEMKDGKCVNEAACKEKCKEAGECKVAGCCAADKADGAKAKGACCSESEGKTASHSAGKSCCAAH
jgi:copper chaperone CopZ